MRNSINNVDNLKKSGKIFFLNIKGNFLFILRGLSSGAEKIVNKYISEGLVIYILRQRHEVIMNMRTTYACQFAYCY